MVLICVLTPGSDDFFFPLIFCQKIQNYSIF